jgi:hypothetical protein
VPNGPDLPDDDDDVDMQDPTTNLSAWKKRRLMPGSSESTSRFRALFADSVREATASLSGVVAEVGSDHDSILGRTTLIMTKIRLAHPAWIDLQVRIACAALSMYRMRLVDLFMREHVLLLWIIEGHRHLRVHDGVCFMYNDCGAFETYKGVPPEPVFTRVKQFLLILEGLFRLLPRDVKRGDDTMLAAIAKSMAEHSTVDAYFAAATDASIFCKGSRRAPKFKASDRPESIAAIPEAPNGARIDAVEEVAEPNDGEDTTDAQGDAPVHWNILVAENISKLGLQIQKELMGTVLISYLIEWCETMDVRRPGVAYLDTCVVYESGSKNTAVVPKSPTANVYMNIPHSLLDPVLEASAENLMVFLEQTFWGNVDVFKCMQAAQALAKRGLNVDRCFIGLSPGGVGQSLYSALIAKMHGALHAYFDPSIWYLDEELRKQVEQFVGCIILTGRVFGEDGYDCR